MTLQKYTRSVDGTIPVVALLYNDEESYASQDGVGIYDGYVAFQFLMISFPMALVEYWLIFPSQGHQFLLILHSLCFGLLEEDLSFDR